MSHIIEQLLGAAVVTNPVVVSLRDAIAQLERELRHERWLAEQAGAEADQLTSAIRGKAPAVVEAYGGLEGLDSVRDQADREEHERGLQVKYLQTQLDDARRELVDAEAAHRQAVKDRQARRLPLAFLVDAARQRVLTSDHGAAFAVEAYHAALTGQVVGEYSPLAAYCS